MQLRRVALAAAFATLAVGCRAGFAGTYHGDLRQSATLHGTDSAGAATSAELADNTATDVVVAESGDALAVDFRGCHFQARRTSPTQAKALAIDCPFPGKPGVTFHVDGATMSFIGKNLSWSWLGTGKQGAATGSFTSGFSGAKK